MPKKNGVLFVILGAVLLMSALLLFLYNEYDAYRAGQDAELLVNDIQSIIAAQKEPTVSDLPNQTEAPQDAEPQETVPEETLDQEMPVVMLGAYGYIGYLSIPELELELPVMSEWDYNRLKYAPCRQCGSTRTDDLVIAAHNFKTHFGMLSELDIGTDIYLTDMDGIENHYTLCLLETLAPDAVEEVLTSGYDLVLYTCTPGGATRVVAFCDRVEEMSQD